MSSISVFTPTHDPKYLKQTYASLVAQDFDDWEWVILDNTPDHAVNYLGLDDPRVSIRVTDYLNPTVKGVGAAKRAAVERCTAPILVELDHDDLLEPQALSVLLRAFKDHPEASLVYSTFTMVDEQGWPDVRRFGPEYGWQSEEDEEGFYWPVSMDPTPHNVSLIWFAPNHVRAFTREAYDQTNGYNADLEVLDDQDLMCQLYQVGEFISLPDRLYVQRMHDSNTQTKKSEQIQVQTWDLYEKYVFGNASAWSKRNNLAIIDHHVPDFCIEPGSAGVIRTYALNRADFPEAVINQAHSALAPNGLLLTMTPYWGADFFLDLVKRGNWQTSRIRTFWAGGKPYTQANLIAIKDGYVRNGGLLGR